MQNLDVSFFVNSILLGVGLAMDAFSVSIANGLSEPKMKNVKRIKIAGCYAFFQFAMPMIGWFFVKSLVSVFKVFEPFIPWIALILLLFIGGKMVIEGIQGLKNFKEDEDRQVGTPVTDAMLILQGIATSIDALSVGFTIDSYSFGAAVLAAVIIAVVTFLICIAGLKIGIKFGELLSDRATILGGIILIFIGIEIFCKGFLL